MSRHSRPGRHRVEAVLASFIDAQDVLRMLLLSDSVTNEAYTSACKSCGLCPSASVVAMATGCLDDPPSDLGLALYARNRVTTVVEHLWSSGELDEAFCCVTIGSLRYLVGIDEEADTLRLMKTVGLLPAD